MARVKGILGQWGLLVTGLLAAAALALQGYPRQSSATVPPGIETYHGVQVYGVRQVLLGMCQQPDQWLGRTILVRAVSTNLEDLIAGSLPIFSCAAPNLGYSGTRLYDPTSSTEIPIKCGRRALCNLADLRNSSSRNADGTRTVPLTRIYRTTLTTSPDCGTPWREHGPCLFGDGAQLISSS